MNWFKNLNSKEEVNRRYRRLAKEYHPDGGTEPDGEIFIELDKQYRARLAELKYGKKSKPPKEDKKKEPEPPYEPQEVDVVEFIPREPRFTPKQKKHLVKGAGLLFNVVAAKLVDRMG